MEPKAILARNRSIRMLAICALLACATIASPQDAENATANIFPIMNYDSDVGFGLGAKVVLRNQWARRESLDLIVYGSTKGENWISLAFSMPDFELRQGTRYPFAIDMRLEFNKILRSNFMGFGNETPDNEFQFPRELTSADVAFSRALSQKVIAASKLRYTHLSTYGFNSEFGAMRSSIPGAGESQVAMVSVSLRLDTRDSQLHATRGIFAEAEYGSAHRALGADWQFDSWRLSLSGYQRVFSESHILALRHWIAQVNGTAPYIEQACLGNSWKLRGYKAERFIDRAMALTSAEYRFPLKSNLGGVLFLDAGRVWPSLHNYSLSNWHTDRGFGLRYYLTTFVARMDVGMSEEGTRLFFNFGHVF